MITNKTEFWDSCLSEVTYHFNWTTHEVTGFTPYLLNLFRDYLHSLNYNINKHEIQEQDEKIVNDDEMIKLAWLYEVKKDIDYKL